MTIINACPRFSFYYYRARFYDPERGRFLNRDPIGYLAGMNLYAYVGNNPLTWVDPFGFEKDDVFSDDFDGFNIDDIEYEEYVPPDYENMDFDKEYWEKIDPPLESFEAPLVDFLFEDIENVWDDAKNGEIDLLTAADLAMAICKPCKLGDKFTDLLKKVCSFEANTPVLTSEGYKSISEVQVGDYVWSKHEDNTGEWSWKPVTDVYSHLHTDGLVLTVQNTDGTTTNITTTAEHPFFTDGNWLRADRLEEGMFLSTADSELPISAINWLDIELPAYNMTVGQSHTYTVGYEQLWVHNDCNLFGKLINGNKAANKHAQKLGYDDAEHLKREYFGNNGAHFDMYYDKKTGLTQFVNKAQDTIVDAYETID